MKDGERKNKIFVSFIYGDLIDERKEVVRAILECNYIPAGMEPSVKHNGKLLRK